jgi:hypothetical protein
MGRNGPTATGSSRVHSRPAVVLEACDEALAVSRLLLSPKSTSMLRALKQPLTCYDTILPP